MTQRIIFLLFLFAGILSLEAQQNDVKIGDEFTIQQPDGYQFDHLDFPRPNFLIKQGIIPDYKSLAGTTVVVRNIATNKEGHEVVTLEPLYKKGFFRHHKAVTAHLDNALAAGELSR